MNRLIFVLILLMTGLCRAADVVVDLQNALHVPLSGRTVIFTPLSTPRTDGTTTIVSDVVKLVLDADGFGVASNMMDGTYDVRIKSTTGDTYVKATVPVTNGVVYLSQLFDAAVVDGVNVAYTKAAADSRFATKAALDATNAVWMSIVTSNASGVAITNGIATNLTVRGLALPVGASNGLFLQSLDSTGLTGWRQINLDETTNILYKELTNVIYSESALASNTLIQTSNGLRSVVESTALPASDLGRTLIAEETETSFWSRLMTGGGRSGSSLYNLNAVAALNVVNFGAVADARRIYDATTTSGSTTLTSATATFTTNDLGKYIVISEALGWTNNLIALITQINSTNSVELSAPATFSMGAGIATLGTDNSVFFQGALDSARLSGGKVYIPSGWYMSGGFTVWTNTSLEGDSWLTTRITSLSASNLVSMWPESEVSHIWCEGGYWNPNMIGLTNSAISFYHGTSTSPYGSRHILVDRCRLQWFDTGIDMEYTWVDSLHKCFFQSCGKGIVARSQVNQVDILSTEIISCNLGILFTNSTFAGVTGSAAQFVVNNCTIENNNGPGIVFDGFTVGARIIASWFEDNGNQGSWSNTVNGSYHIRASGNYTATYDATVANNLFLNSQNKNSDAVAILGARFCNAAGNRGSGWTGTLIRFSGESSFVGNNDDGGYGALANVSTGSNGVMMLTPYEFLGGAVGSDSGYYTTSGGARNQTLGFFNKAIKTQRVVKQNVSGDVNDGTGLSSLITALTAYGLFTNSTTATNLPAATNLYLNRPYARLAGPVGVTNSTTETTLFTTTIPAGLLGSSGGMCMKYFAHNNGASGTVTYKLKWNGTQVSSSGAVNQTSQTFVSTVDVVNQTATAQVSGSVQTSFGAASSAPTYSTIDTTAAVTVTLTATPSVTGCTNTLEWCYMYLTPGN